MDKNKVYHVALVLYTSGIDFDDRIRKEILSIQRLFSNVSFEIFAVEPNNREERGVTSYGVPYHIPYLKTRDKYQSGTHTMAKAWDFFRTVKKELDKFDAIWCADGQTFFFMFLLTGKPMLLDLHEMPLFLMGSWWKRKLFRYLERKLDVIVHANTPRLNYLKAQGMIRYPEKHFVLRNYPDFNEIDSEYDDTYHSFIKWLGDGQCVYLQGLTRRERADEESIGAVLKLPDLKAVVVGRISEDQMTRFESLYGKEVIRQRVFFTGQIKQLKTPQYIKKCAISLIFYKNTSINNWYCEPNRLFQNIVNNTPVVVGNNPPLKDIVDQYKVGVVANTDGSNMLDIVKAMKKLLDNMEEYNRNIAMCKSNWLWQSQDFIIQRIVETYLKN